MRLEPAMGGISVYGGGYSLLSSWFRKHNLVVSLVNLPPKKNTHGSSPIIVHDFALVCGVGGDAFMVW